MTGGATARKSSVPVAASSPNPPPPAAAAAANSCIADWRASSIASSSEKSLTCAATRSPTSRRVTPRATMLIAPPADAWRSRRPSMTTSGSVRTVSRSRS